MGPNFETFRNLQHYDEYYLPGGDLYCIVEDKLFRVHRYFFERESTFFKSKLGTPATPGVSRIGTAEDSAVLLDNVSTKDFAKLLWVFYNPKYSLYDAGVEDWSTILRLADRWVFAEVKNLAVRELEKKEMPDIDRIVLYHQFKVDEEHLLPRYAALCERPELLTVDEGLKLGMEIVIPLSRARECARNLASTSGSSSPSPAGLDGNELTNIIKDHFGIKPTKSPGGLVTLSFPRLGLIDALQQRRLLDSPTIVVPEPGTRHQAEMAASQTPTVPASQTPTAPILTATIEGKEIHLGEEVHEEQEAAHDEQEAAHEEGDDEDNGGDSGNESETVKDDSENEEDPPSSTYEEVKENADTAGESQDKAEDSGATDDALTEDADESKSQEVDQGDADSKLTPGTSEAPPVLETMADDESVSPVTPLIDLDVKAAASLSDDEDEDNQSFYDSPEGPDGFDGFSLL
ncbi:hypothetical protein B0H10DRAFT_495799 [Mycena sp. CBHHK59/15]|nr:hypothetical protein B0H10DRAFT_495799 [Mycena sp. CBHHK59/15]